MARKYFAGKNASFNDQKAQAYGDHLQQLKDKHGNITPALIVESARQHNSPIHDRFLWDNEQAAEAHRRQQARILLNVIDINHKGKRVRAFESVRVHYLSGPDDEETKTARIYLPQVEIRKDPELHSDNLRDILRWLVHFKDRYGTMKELGPVIQAIEELEGELLGEPV